VPAPCAWRKTPLEVQSALRLRAGTPQWSPSARPVQRRSPTARARCYPRFQYRKADMASGGSSNVIDQMDKAAIFAAGGHPTSVRRVPLMRELRSHLLARCAVVGPSNKPWPFLGSWTALPQSACRWPGPLDRRGGAVGHPNDDLLSRGYDAFNAGDLEESGTGAMLADQARAAGSCCRFPTGPVGSRGHRHRPVFGLPPDFPGIPGEADKA
jgi:hypothetical protein